MKKINCCVLWWKQYGEKALYSLGILLCILANVDFFALVGVELSIPIVGVVLSGLLVSRGSNFVHDFVQLVYNLRANNESDIF